MKTALSIREKDLIEIAWRERRECVSWLGGSQDEMPIDSPSWFRRQELGFAIEHGPSFAWCCQNLQKHNANSILQLGLESPDRVTYPKNFKDPRRALRRGVKPAPRRRTARDRELTIDEEIAAAMSRAGVKR